MLKLSFIPNLTKPKKALNLSKYDSSASNKTLEHLNLCIIRKWGHTDMGQRQALSSTLWAKLCKPNRMHAAYIHIDCPVNVYLDNNRAVRAKYRIYLESIEIIFI